MCTHNEHFVQYVPERMLRKRCLLTTKLFFFSFKGDQLALVDYREGIIGQKILTTSLYDEINISEMVEGAPHLEDSFLELPDISLQEPHEVHNTQASSSSHTPGQADIMDAEGYLKPVNKRKPNKKLQPTNCLHQCNAEGNSLTDIHSLTSDHTLDSMIDLTGVAEPDIDSHLSGRMANYEVDASDCSDDWHDAHTVPSGRMGAQTPAPIDISITHNDVIEKLVSAREKCEGVTIIERRELTNQQLQNNGERIQVTDAENRWAEESERRESQTLSDWEEQGEVEEQREETSFDCESDSLESDPEPTSLCKSPTMGSMELL